MRLFRLLIGLLTLGLIGGLLTACAPQAGAPASARTAQPDAATEAMPERPSSPAAEDGDFRADSPLHVAATGRPQLIEVFSYD
jgi:hypothetical protein